MFRNIYLDRSQKMYKEAIFNLAILKHSSKIKGKEEGLIIMNAIKGEFEIYGYTMPDDVRPQLEYLVKLGWLETTEEGYVNISELGIKKLQSGELEKHNFNFLQKYNK